MSNQPRKPICIYHGDCFDGFTAAWAVWKLFGDDFEYVSGRYGAPPPDVTDRHVFVVDFSFKRGVLIEMAQAARSLTVLDHHKTAAEDLAGFPAPLPLISNAYRPWWPEWRHEDPQPRVLFDMDRSGAGIAWDFFHPQCFEDDDRPALVSHVEDRDLWRFNLPFTREIHAAMSAYPFEFAAWDELAAKCERGELAAEGGAIDRKHKRDIATLVPIMRRRVVIGGHTVWAASLPMTMTSDAGHMMAQGEPFAACYWDTAEGRTFSLRSTPEGVDVSEIAKTYGGGGHRNAAGFSISHDRIGEIG